MKKFLTPVALFLVVLGASFSPAATVVIQPTVLANPPLFGTYNPANSCSQTGLSVTYASGSTAYSTYIAQNPVQNTNGAILTTYVMTADGNPTGNWDYDLGATYSLKNFLFWNTQNDLTTYVKTFEILVANNPSFTGATSAGTFTANPSSPDYPTPLETFNLAATTGRYVRFKVTSNNGAARMLFGEVAFAGDAVVVDTTPPTLTAVSISSDNASSTWAKLGDTLTLTFTASETINTPAVTLAGRSASVGLVSGNTWSATLAVNGADPEGLASLNIAFSDLAANAGAAVTATTDSSAVTIDKTAPVITSSGAASGTYRTAFSFTVEASGAPASFGATGLPAGLAITPATGAIAGTPTQSGAVTATVTATDAAGNTGSGSLDISLAKAGLAATGIVAQNKTYDTTNSATLDLSAAALSGVLGGDNVTLDTTAVTAAFASPDVGAAKPVTISGLALSGADATHYTLAQPVATAEISAATLTVTADAQTRPYGYDNLTLTATITGFVGGETPALLSGAPQLSTAANTASLPGAYPITVDLATLSAPNYTFVAADGTLTVRKLVYADWRAENFDALELVDDAISGPLADPDFDGISNLAEFAFDTDPHSGASGPASLSYVGPLAGVGALEATGHPVTLFDTSTVSDFRAVFIRRASAYTAGLTYDVVFSNDLVTWTPVVEAPAILATDGLLEVVSLPYPALFNNGEDRAFFRIQVQNAD